MWAGMNVPGLHRLHRTDHDVRRESVHLNGHTIHQEIHEIIHVEIRLARLQPRQERDEDWLQVLMQRRPNRSINPQINL